MIVRMQREAVMAIGNGEMPQCGEKGPEYDSSSKSVHHTPPYSFKVLWNKLKKFGVCKITVLLMLVLAYVTKRKHLVLIRLETLFMLLEKSITWQSHDLDVMSHYTPPNKVISEAPATGCQGNSTNNTSEVDID
jgi:hypothetical protein